MLSGNGHIGSTYSSVYIYQNSGSGAGYNGISGSFISNGPGPAVSFYAMSTTAANYLSNANFLHDPANPIVLFDGTTADFSGMVISNCSFASYDNTGTAIYVNNNSGNVTTFNGLIINNIFVTNRISNVYQLFQDGIITSTNFDDINLGIDHMNPASTNNIATNW